MVDNVEMETKEIQKIPWDKSIWFFDIDDTLIDTAGTTLGASDAIRDTLGKKIGQDKAKQIQANFNQIFNLMLSGHQASEDHNPGEYNRIISRIEACQSRIKEKYGVIKKWSREVFIKIAADDAGINLAPELVRQAADAYWLSLTEKTELFPGVENLMELIQKHKRPIYLITSSDARLKMDENGQFDYDPPYSEALKRQRIEHLKKKGIQFNGLSIGDPEDKPHLDFFKKGIKVAESNLGQQVDFTNAIMVGDSFAGDLQVPKEEFGFGLIVLFNKNVSSTQTKGENQVNTGDVFNVRKYLT